MTSSTAPMLSVTRGPTYLSGVGFPVCPCFVKNLVKNAQSKRAVPSRAPGKRTRIGAPGRRAKRLAGHNFEHVRDRGMSGASDVDIFVAAAADDRVVVSADTDFGTLPPPGTTQEAVPATPLAESKGHVRAKSGGRQ